MTVIETLFTATISSSVVSGLIVYFFQFWIQKNLDYKYSSKLESHKAKIKSLNDIEIEKLKSSLSVEANRHNIIFNKMHERRAEVIAKTYSLFVDSYVKLEAYTSPIETVDGASKEERRKAFGNAIEEFTSHYLIHAIYLPEKIVEKLKEFDSQMTKHGISFMTKVEMNDSKSIQDWNKISQEVKEIRTSAMASLRFEFQKILGA
ncbi:hypothetical protein JYT85_02865 [Desulfocapsa sp. AH-315-G09]|nr:hypothetical protein [Desulfocapsa sp. AH-315-G09]